MLFSLPNFLVLSAIIIIILQFWFFVFAAIFKTDKLTDLSYALTFILVAFVCFGVSHTHLRTTLISIAIMLWGLRLGLFLFVRILKMGKDHRFDGRRENAGAFAKFWIFQALVIWITLLPLSFLAGSRGQYDMSIWDALGMGIFLLGLIIETIADQQKNRFRNDPANKNRFVNIGLWEYARHPNYFGEILVWWGIFIWSLPGLYFSNYIAILSPICITWILMKVSGIPLLEKSHEERYGSDPNFMQYKKDTRLLIPLAKSKSQ